MLLRKLSLLTALLLVACSSLSMRGQSDSARQIVQAVDDSKTTVLRGNVHPMARPAFDQGTASNSLTLQHMLLLLKRDDASERNLSATMADLYNPNSSGYHKWLLPAEYGKRFGPASSDVATISSWLSSNGFSDIKLSAGGTVLEFSGSAGAVRNGFHTEIHKYSVQGQAYWANATDPQVPEALAPVIKGIVSLNNFPRNPMHKDIGVLHFDKKTNQWSKLDSLPEQKTGTATKAGSVQPQLTFSDPYSGTTYYAVGPGDFAKIYNVQSLWDAGIDGSGQEIAIVGRSGFNQSDVDQFRAGFGLPATKLKTIVVNQMPDINASAGETLLDLQWSGAIARNATIDYVVASSTNTTDGVDLASLYAVDNNVAPIVSVSYGLCEAALGTTGNAYYNEIWRQAAAQGITVTVASGDNAAASCDTGYFEASYGLQVNGLASTPYDVAVGGTDFNDFGGPNGQQHTDYWGTSNDPQTRASALSYIPEMAWNDSCANSQIYGKFNYGDAESFCNSSIALNDGLLRITGGSGGVSSCTVLDPNGQITDCAGGYSKPDWQNVAGVPDDAKRDLPDLSLFAADGVARSFYVYCRADYTADGYCNYDNATDIEYLAAGGTSFATPAFAGIMALVNQKVGLRQGNANYVLYNLARNQFGSAASPISSKLAACSSEQGTSTDPSCVFHDVVSGGNALPCVAGSLNCAANNPADQIGVLTGYQAQAGFDPATGLGSLNAANLVNGWAQTAPPTPTATTLSLTPNSGTYGDTLTYNVSVAPTTGSGTPSGSVILIANQQTVASADLSGGKATGTVNSLIAGNYAVTASYVSNGVYASSTSNSVTVALAPAQSTSTLALYEVNPQTGTTAKTTTVHYGSGVQAVATVAGLSNLAIPTGNVQFTSTGTDGQSAPLASATATIALSQLAVGAKESITANYAGDTNYHASSSAAMSFSVVQAASHARLTGSTNYLVGSGSLTLHAVIWAYSTGSKPTGSIDLYLNGAKYATAAGTQGIDAITGGVALTGQFTVPSSALKSGANTLSISYGGDGNYTAVQSGALPIGFGATAPSTSLALTVTPQPAATQQSITLTAAVMAGAIPAIGGSVSFYDNGTKLGETTLVRTPLNETSATGVATFKVRLAAGSHSLTATYSGAAALPATQTASPVTLTVTGKQNSAVSLAVDAVPTHVNHYDFTATVLGYGKDAPTGTLTLNESSTVATLTSGTPDPTTAKAVLGNPGLFSMSSAILYIANGDMNNDGIADLVMRIRGNYNDQIEIFLGKGDGTFTLAGSYTVGLATTGHLVSLVDINADGALDVVTGDQQDQTLSVLLGNGDGTLQPRAIIQTAPLNPMYVFTFDVNKDGIPDLVVAGAIAGTQVYFGNGDGSFQPAISSPVANSKNLLSYADFADINHDGNLDIVYLSYLESPKTLHVALGAMDGTFTNSSTTYPLGSSFSSRSDVNLADVDGDGNLDAIYSDFFGGMVVIAKGDGLGGFGAPVSYAAGPSNARASGAKAVDFNHNGKPDIVVNDAYNATLDILPNKGDGTFGAPTGFYNEPTYTSEVHAVDLNGDGQLDLVTTGQVYQSPYSLVLLGGTQTVTKFRDVAADGSAATIQQGYVSFAGDDHYTASNSNSVSFNGSGTKADPKILWAPSATTWATNTPLGPGILDATTYGSIPGSYLYTAQLSGQPAVVITAASQLTATGDYTLTVTFTPSNTDDYNSASAQQLLHIVAPDFSIAAATGSTPLVLKVASTATTTLTLNPLYGFNAAVALSCTSPNSGIACSFSPTTLIAGSTATLTVSASAPVAQMRATVENNKPRKSVIAAALLCAVMLSFSRKHRRLATSMCQIALVGLALLCGCAGSNAPETTSLTLSSSNPSAASGTTAVLTANLSAPNPVDGGTVSFYDGTTLLGTGTLSKSVATLSVNTLAVGVHSLTAKFATSGRLQASVSNPITQVVTGAATVKVIASYGAVQRTIDVPVALQ